MMAKIILSHVASYVIDNIQSFRPTIRASLMEARKRRVTYAKTP